MLCVCPRGGTSSALCGLPFRGINVNTVYGVSRTSVRGLLLLLITNVMRTNINSNIVITVNAQKLRRL